MDQRKPSPNGSGSAQAAGAAAKPPLDDGKRLQNIKNTLKNSPTGAAAVKYLEDKKVKVEFANGGGSYWDGKKIVVDRSEKVDRSALVLVHEINHAKASIDGPKADVVKDTRANYVKKMLEEETRGTVASIKTKGELTASGKTIADKFPLEQAYNNAYNTAVKAAAAKNPKATNAELKKIGEEAGTNAVLKGFQDGKVVTSNTSAKYPDYYGQAWDVNHPTK